jgi:predicted glycoside hydrolase/deacetylase ChbG (UPF0249 family)
VPAIRRLWLCADDYGIAPGVNRAIRDLLARGRINATSVMVVGPSFSAAEALALAESVESAAAHAAIGLHFTLTAPFRPASRDYWPAARVGTFLDLPRTLAAGWLHRLDAGALAAEAASQFAAFRRAFDRPPDFVDGHQHVQLLPQVGDALMAVMKEAAPSAWLRQCGRAVPLSRRWRDRKGLALDLMSARLAARSARRGIATNPAFAGTYNFRREVPYGALFASFLDHLPAGSLVMCHPGFVDAELRRLDGFLAMREVEHAFFAGERFPQLLASHGFALA